MHSFRKKIAVALGCLTVAAVFLSPPASRGDDWNLATRFSVSQPFQVPKMVLEPNTNYVIRIHDSPATRQVVQIYNEDQTKMLTMFIAISAQRFEPKDETQFTFMETSPGYPVPIKEWFYPGRLTGLEFIYPKDQAEEIAAHSRDRVATTEVAELREPAEAPIAAPVEENQAEAELEIPAPQVEEPVEIAQNQDNEPLLEEPAVEQSPVETAAVAVSEDREELPRTAGELPVFALIGMLCLGLGLGMKVLFREM